MYGIALSLQSIFASDIGEHRRAVTDILSPVAVHADLRFVFPLRRPFRPACHVFGFRPGPVTRPVATGSVMDRSGDICTVTGPFILIRIRRRWARSLGSRRDPGYQVGTEESGEILPRSGNFP